ncbi:MAG: four helix bundle protein [Ignavibacteriales bacterium]|nr:four helix bundle protein [Ignavibacteriales bacterium]
MQEPQTNTKGSYSFEDLEVYKAAREFRKKIFDLIKSLPSEEKFNLASQMRRAATSVTNNVAEGHGRYHYQENIQFLRQARGSLEELIDDLNICLDEKYFPEDRLNQLKEEGFNLLHRINGYIAYLRKKKQENSELTR